MKSRTPEKQSTAKVTGQKTKGPIISAEEIKHYRNVSTERKIEWLEEMAQILFASMTPKLLKRREALRKKGY